MSNDLISRSALSKEICNKECDVPEFETERELNAFLLGLNAKQIKIMECLSDMPTAYDVDKVVEQLEEYAHSNICNLHNRCPYRDNEDINCENCGAIGAVEIVKSGGIE